MGVTPALAFAQRKRLWRALEDAFPVRFEPRGPSELDGLDALVAHREDVDLPRPLPMLRTYAEESPGAPVRVRLGNDERLDRCLRGRELGDGGARDTLGLRCARGEAILARRGGAAIWVARRSDSARHRAAVLPAELGPTEPLRARMRAGRFLALLPLLTLINDVTEDSAWIAPPLRAAFVLDDPNLHWPSYGHLDFARLAHRARSERFHLACATVPIDAWYAHPAAVRLFKEESGLSLLVHGNDHTWCELARTVDECSTLGLAAQALRRVRALERRTGLHLARVMAPPHGRCSAEMLHALRRTGFSAACISRPCPWLNEPPADRPLAQWDIADVVGGLPVLPRYPLSSSSDDIPLRASLGQPLILYGHHGDLATGDRLGEMAALVNSLGDVHWGDLGSIAASSFLQRREGDALEVRMYAREARIDLSAGVRRVTVELPAQCESAGGESVIVSGAAAGETVAALGQSIELAPGQRSLRVRLASADAVNADQVPAPPRRLWPRARRLLVEGRDRLAPARELAGRRRPFKSREGS